MTNVVYVRFDDGREFPYLNDRFDLTVGDKVYVDGKLSGIIGEVTEVLESFKVSLKYYKYVTAKLDFGIKGKFEGVDGFFVSTDGEAVPFAQMLDWIKCPDSCQEEPEEFICGKGYEINLNDLYDEDGEPEFDGCCDAIDIEDVGNLKFVSVVNGTGKAAVVNGKHVNIVDFKLDIEKMCMSDVFCDCISPRLCDDIINVAYTLEKVITSLEIKPDTDFSIIEGELFGIVTDGMNKTVII